MVPSKLKKKCFSDSWLFTHLALRQISPSVTTSVIHQAKGRTVLVLTGTIPVERKKIPQAVNGRTVSEDRSCWVQGPCLQLSVVVTCMAVILKISQFASAPLSTLMTNFLTSVASSLTNLLIPKLMMLTLRLHYEPLNSDWFSKCDCVMEFLLFSYSRSQKRHFRDTILMSVMIAVSTSQSLSV